MLFLPLKGVFAKNERRYRVNAIKSDTNVAKDNRWLKVLISEWFVWNYIDFLRFKSYVTIFSICMGAKLFVMRRL